jgi:hypothetical protein
MTGHRNDNWPGRLAGDRASAVSRYSPQGGQDSAS